MTAESLTITKARKRYILNVERKLFNRNFVLCKTFVGMHGQIAFTEG